MDLKFPNDHENRIARIDWTAFNIWAKITANTSKSIKVFLP